MALSPVSSRSGVPAWWTVDSTAGTQSLTLVSTAPYADFDNVLVVVAGAGGGVLFVDSGGGIVQELRADATVMHQLNNAASTLTDYIRATVGAAIRFRVGGDGSIVTASHSAPADGDLAAGECALWFDQTNGAGNTKLMVKAKSADGTVKTATILLA